MKNKIVIFGAGGFGREVAYLINQINSIKPVWDLIGFVDDNPKLAGNIINGVPVVGTGQYLLESKKGIAVAVALCQRGKEKVIKKLFSNSKLQFPNLLWPGLYVDDSNEFGIGNIICHGGLMTCNIKLGNFNIFNGNTGVGHDCEIGDYNLFGPNSFIAGEVKIGNSNIFTMNVSVIQQRTIGDGNTINLNSVLIRNIENNGTYFGVPAMKQTF